MSAIPIPANWKNGFQYPYAIACGGTEIPYFENGAWKIRVWNCENGEHYVYDYSTDLFESELTLT